MNALVDIGGLGIGAADHAVAPVVDAIDLSLAPGAAFGIAGESGSGKSTLLLAMMGIVKPGLTRRAGTSHFDGIDLFGTDLPALEKLRGGRIALVPQNASLALTPNIRIGDQIAEVLRYHTDLPEEQHKARIAELLAEVKLPDAARLGRRFPHELSGGQLQRVGIAMALAGAPDLLLLDEPTTGLDVTTQVGILDLLAEIRATQGMAMVCVSHDLGVLARLCDDIAIMYAGRIIEQGPVSTLLTHPAHPYARALLASIPRLAEARIPASIPGRPPAPEQALAGCRFAPRCQHTSAICGETVPAYRALATIAPHQIACHHPQQDSMGAAGSQAPDARPDLSAAETRISIENLAVTYQRRRPLLPFLAPTVVARTIADLTLKLRKGEILGLVGESGSGKSTLLKTLAGLWPALDGRITLDGRIDLTEPVTTRDRDALRRMQLIFQNPDASLNPRHTIREILAQPLRLYFDLSRDEIEKRATQLLGEVRLDASYLARFPSDLSGGERQRVAIARAFAAEPEVILCDEITSALDVSVQASILQIISDLSRDHGVACLFVSHDLAVVRAIADHIAVLYRGQLVEIGSARQVCEAPKEDYTRRLLAAVLEPEPAL
jgi:peptide/nickel transport system ATP-binding protein